MRNIRAGRSIITFVAVFTIISPYVFDWNQTHIYNPHWTPHAKFHNAQTMLLAVVLGTSTLWFTWRSARDISAQKVQLRAALVFASAYWITQLGSVFFPGTALIDPEFAANAVPFQPIVDVVIFILLGIAYSLERKRLKNLQP